MRLIFGGAYQGKLDFALETFRLNPEQVFTCNGTEIDFSKPCIDKLEEFTYACVGEKIDPVAYFRDNADKWRDAVLICQDMSCGVVPLGAEMREWRQNTGLLCQYLSREAESVHRIFCGLEQRLK